MGDTQPPAEIRTVRDALEAKAETHGDATFLHYDGQKVSYSDLNQRANAVANALRTEGISPNDHVCLHLYNSLEYLYAAFGLLKLGAVIAPIDTRFTGDTLVYVLSQTDADTLFLDSKTREDYEEIRSELSNITAEYFVGDSETDHQYRDFDNLLEGEKSTPPDVAISQSDTASVTYVQRHSTERPKGVLLPQYSYVNTGWEAGQNIFEYSADDRIFAALPLYGIFTFQLGIMGAFMADAKFVLADRFNPDTFWDQIVAADATVFLYLGRALSVLYNQDLEPDENTAEIAIGHGYGFDTDEELIADFEERFDITVLEGYGDTQTTITTYNYPDDRQRGSVGKPVSFVDIQIVDDTDWPVPQGETGEIVVRPKRPHTMIQGYHNDPDHTVEVCRNQWVHTGDIGYIDEDGYLYFVANRQNSIYRGRIAGRISSLEIESVIDNLSPVRESSVIGVTNERGHEEIKAVVVPIEGIDINPVEICQYCERKLPHLKVPRYIEIQTELSRDSLGKVQKQKLAAVNTDDVWDRKSGYDLSR